jgi:hypothetical protein
MDPMDVPSFDENHPRDMDLQERRMFHAYGLCGAYATRRLKVYM